MAKKKSVLAQFDGRDVLNTTIAITNAGDGLSKALGIDPVELHHGQTVYVVMECEVSKVSFSPVKDTDGLSRVHTLKAGNATMVDRDLVKEVLEAQVVKLEEAAGITRLPMDDVDDPTSPGLED